MPRDLLFCISGRAPAIPFLRAQLMEQRLGVLQIGGVEALGEPAVDLGKDCARLVTRTMF